MKTTHSTPPILSASGRALIASSIAARLPLATFSIALLVHAQQLTGSFAVAGVVSGAYAISGAVSAPVLGRLVDRCGQTRVLLSGATLAALALVITGMLPVGAPAAVQVALAVAAGMTTPPLGACVRTLLPAIVSEPDRLPALFAFESTALEITFVLGPPLALGVGAVWSTGAALASAGLLMLIATVMFAWQPASRAWRPDRSALRRRGGSLGSAAILVLALMELGCGAVFGATEVGITAAAKALGSTAAAGPILGIWGLGSLFGGIVATRVGGGARRSSGLIMLIAALAVAHGALIFATGNVLALGALILLAGATIAPTAASIYAMVDRFAPAGTVTEAFSWALTAAYTGEALGAAVGGGLVQGSGATAAFAFVGAAGAVTILVAFLGRRHLDGAAAEPAAPAAAPDAQGPAPVAQGRGPVARAVADPQAA
jgi:predicted MFS family arabinose efflux permease